MIADTTKKSVLFDPSPKQIEFLNAVFSNRYRKILFGGAIRGGKTYAGLGALLLLCKFYPGSIWAVVRDSLPTLKRTTIKSFKKVCPAKFIQSYNQETQTVTMTNGSQIIFFPENYDDDKELDRWKGLEVSGFLLEEVNELQEVSFWKAVERAGSFIPKPGIKKPKPLVMMTCNPANNWVKKLIYDKYMGKEDPETGLPMSLPEDFLYIPSKITDNPFVMADPEYLESLKSLPAYQYKVFVEGDWDIQLKTGGEYLKCFELDKHVWRQNDKRGSCDYDPNLPIHISWDDNVNPYLPCGMFQFTKTPAINNGKTVYNFEVRMIDEIASATPRNNISNVCNEIKRKYPNHKSGMFIYGDATANKEDTKLEKGYNFYRLILEELSEYKPTNRVISHNPNVVQRANWMNTVLEKQAGGITMWFAERCKTAVNDFILLKEDENGGKAKFKKKNPATGVTEQVVGHFTDLLEYFMVSCFALQFEQWQTGGAVSSIRFGKNAVSKNSY